MVCDLLDLRCIFVNELIGSVFLAGLFIGLAYFALASKLKFGFDTTMTFAVPVMLAFALILGGFQIILAVSSIFAGMMLAYAVSKVIGNR